MNWERPSQMRFNRHLLCRPFLRSKKGQKPVECAANIIVIRITHHATLSPASPSKGSIVLLSSQTYPITAHCPLFIRNDCDIVVTLAEQRLAHTNTGIKTVLPTGKTTGYSMIPTIAPLPNANRRATAEPCTSVNAPYPGWGRFVIPKLLLETVFPLSNTVEDARSSQPINGGFPATLPMILS